MQAEFGPDLSMVISVLQTALTPAFLLVAVGSLLNVLTGRLSRIVNTVTGLLGSFVGFNACHCAASSLFSGIAMASLSIADISCFVAGIF